MVGPNVRKGTRGSKRTASEAAPGNPPTKKKTPAKAGKGAPGVWATSAPTIHNDQQLPLEELLWIKSSEVCIALYCAC